jgi:hypothetical protein
MPAPHAVAVDWRAEVPRDVHGNQHQALDTRRARHASRDEPILRMEHETRFELAFPSRSSTSHTRCSLIALSSPFRWQGELDIS